MEMLRLAGMENEWEGLHVELLERVKQTAQKALWGWQVLVGTQRTVYNQELPTMKKGLQPLRGHGGKTQKRAGVLRHPEKDREDREYILMMYRGGRAWKGKRSWSLSVPKSKKVSLAPGRHTEEIPTDMMKTEESITWPSVLSQKNLELPTWVRAAGMKGWWADCLDTHMLLCTWLQQCETLKPGVLK